MRKTTVVPFVFVLLGLVSSDQTGSPGSRSVDFINQERAYSLETHEPLLEAYGRQKSADSAFGDNPVIQRAQHPNVKTSQRKDYAIPLTSQPREPSIQAYGLPKKTVESNGQIERVNLQDRVSGLDGKVDKVRNQHPGIQAYGLPKKIAEDNGVIERLGSSEGRRTRSVDELAKNDLEDLEAQEAKVFRPLFVYRQQIADRYRLNPRKNPIYGSYQYGANRPKKVSPGYRKNYLF